MATALAFQNPAHEQAHQFHVRLNHSNAIRLAPALLGPEWQANLYTEYETRVEEGLFVEHERHLIQRAARAAPGQPAAFLRWFEELRKLTTATFQLNSTVSLYRHPGIIS